MVIMNKVDALIREVMSVGHRVNGTKELNNVQIAIDLNDIKLTDESREVRKYYDDNGIDYSVTLASKKDNYNFFTYAMANKISEVNFYFKLVDFTSRKYVVFSEGCISMLQLLHRDDKTVLNVMMRSADIQHLLPMDILYLCKLFLDVKTRHNIKSPHNKLFVNISSAHIEVKK